MQHNKYFSPSAASRWLACPASVWECKDLVDKGSAYAAEGTVAHAIAEHCLKNDVSAAAVPNVGPDAIAHIDTYVGIVRSVTAGAQFIDYEVRLDLSTWLGAGQQGTSDVVAIVGRRLKVIDLKYGTGVKVSAEHNDQLQIYALGALELARLLGYDIDDVEMIISQPRIFSEPSTFVIPVTALLSYGQYVRQSVRDTEDMLLRGPVDSEYNPGEKQCRFCRAKAQCRKLQQVTADAVRDEFALIPATSEIATVLEQPADSEVAQLAKVLPMLDVIEQWIGAKRDRANALMLNGTAIPGYKLVLGRGGNRVWKDEKEAENILKSMRLHVDEMYQMKVISPTNAEKLLKGTPRRWKRLVSLVSRSAPKPTVVPASDPRPAISAIDVKNEFEVLESPNNQKESV